MIKIREEIRFPVVFESSSSKQIGNCSISPVDFKIKGDKGEIPQWTETIKVGLRTVFMGAFQNE
jgi:hypothetical protein